jgi:hypothetical protein
MIIGGYIYAGLRDFAGAVLMGMALMAAAADAKNDGSK